MPSGTGECLYGFSGDLLPGLCKYNLVRSRDLLHQTALQPSRSLHSWVSRTYCSQGPPGWALESCPTTSHPKAGSAVPSVALDLPAQPVGFFWSASHTWPLCPVTAGTQVSKQDETSLKGERTPHPSTGRGLGLPPKLSPQNAF